MEKTITEYQESGYGSDENFSHEDKEQPLSFEVFCDIYNDNIKEKCYEEYPDIFKIDEPLSEYVEFIEFIECIEYELVCETMYDKYLEGFD